MTDSRLESGRSLQPAISTASIVAASVNSRMLGMTGKLTLKATQAPHINEALSPSPTELAWACETVGRAGRTDFDGSYLPMLARARALLSLATDLGIPIP